MEKNILFRAVIEVLGKPKEHVDSSLKGYLQKLKEDGRYEVVEQDLADIKKHDQTNMWMAFAELEIKTENVGNIIDFCFDYMPSLIEIIEPMELKLDNVNLSMFLNDLQAKLHGVDMIAKQLKTENDILKSNTAILLKNYLTLLLGNRKLSSEKLAELTGIEKDKLEDFLDKLIDEGKVDLEDDLYYLKSRVSAEN